MTIVEQPAVPPVEIKRLHRIRLGASLREFWQARELVRTLAEREFRVRYKQTTLGFAWALLTPFVLMVVFTLFFHRIARVDTHGAPYPLFAYLGLLPWTFFSSSVSQGGQSLLTNVSLINKVYCPREVFPTASVCVAGIDSAVAVLALSVLFPVTGFAPKATAVWVPVLLVVQVAFTLGVALIFSAVMVYLRDLRHALPVILQLGLFATPVAYGIEAIPQSMRLPYAALNPLAGVIDGYRRTILFGLPPSWDLVAAGAATAFSLLIVAYLLFKRLETGFADVA